ncbi:hypothetical protein PCASD_20600 [Puccinia coronata f. sp. avenae]|uniref:Uncharacterized protein n=1 Tax=Puccinia coronata f. sp. avenae TaxID=200324 RepID=A0A2N5TQI2_9BASI|nr:hypothetical protein PCASD_20600 [Puccinia coronata f. sp. avenae]
MSGRQFKSMGGQAGLTTGQRELKPQAFFILDMPGTTGRLAEPLPPERGLGAAQEDPGGSATRATAATAVSSPSAERLAFATSRLFQLSLSLAQAPAPRHGRASKPFSPFSGLSLPPCCGEVKDPTRVGGWA